MENKLKIHSPEDYLAAFWAKLRGGEGKTPALCAIVSALLSALLAYHLLIITGHGNPDAVCEGLVNYTGADWALACGRWATRYMNELSGNVIMPGIWVSLYALCCAFISILLSKLWKIESRAAVCLMTVLLTVNPTVIEQSLLQYMFMAWGISNLLSALFVYLCCTEGKWYRRYVIAPICMTAAFGLYQACLSMMCLMFCMTLILRLLEGEGIKDSLMQVLKFALPAILGAAMYFIIMEVEFVRWGVEESGRVGDFSLGGIIAALPESFPQAYRTFIEYFSDERFRRMQLYTLLFAMAAAYILLALFRLLKARRFIEAGFALLLTALIPAMSNAADIVFPYNVPVLIMQYQSMLVVPFLLALVQGVKLKKPSLENLSRIVACICLLCLSWGYVAAANATYKAYELSYRYYYHAVSTVLDDIYAMPEFYEGVPIAFAGFPDDSHLRQTLDVYDQAYGMYENLAFWNSFSGLQEGRRNYLTNYFGVNGEYVLGGMYNETIQSEEFRQMPVWPFEGCISYMNYMIFVKFSDDPHVIT